VVRIVEKLRAGAVADVPNRVVGIRATHRVAPLADPSTPAGGPGATWAADDAAVATLTIRITAAEDTVGANTGLASHRLVELAAAAAALVVGEARRAGIKTGVTRPIRSVAGFDSGRTTDVVAAELPVRATAFAARSLACATAAPSPGARGALRAGMAAAAAVRWIPVGVDAGTIADGKAGEVTEQDPRRPAFARDAIAEVADSGSGVAIGTLIATRATMTTIRLQIDAIVSAGRGAGIRTDACAASALLSQAALDVAGTTVVHGGQRDAGAVACCLLVGASAVAADAMATDRDRRAAVATAAAMVVIRLEICAAVPAIVGAQDFAGIAVDALAAPADGGVEAAGKTAGAAVALIGVEIDAGAIAEGKTGEVTEQNSRRAAFARSAIAEVAESSDGVAIGADLPTTAAVAVTRLGIGAGTVADRPGSRGRTGFAEPIGAAKSAWAVQPRLTGDAVRARGERRVWSPRRARGLCWSGRSSRLRRAGGTGGPRSGRRASRSGRAGGTWRAVGLFSPERFPPDRHAAGQACQATNDGAQESTAGR
jgi:hypothetical protein